MADIGCGKGYFTLLLAKRVGPEGKVYAEDIDRDALDEVRYEADKQGFTQVQTVHGTADDPHLPPGSLDVALTVNSYHEWRQYDAMLDHLYAALKPGGLLGVIDGEADPGRSREFYHLEHKMPEQMERDDLARHGFQFLREGQSFMRTDDGKKLYFIILQKPVKLT